MTLLAALDELTSKLASDEKLVAWLKKYSANNRALQVFKSNRKVADIQDRHLPCVILELPDGEYGQRHMGGIAQDFSHQIDLIFAIHANRDDFDNGFNSRVELMDQVLPSFMLKTDRLANYVSDIKLLKFTTDSGLNFPKVFVQATVLLSGKCKRD